MSLQGRQIAGTILGIMHETVDQPSTGMLREAYQKLQNLADSYDAKLLAEISYLLARCRELTIGERKAFAEESIRIYRGLNLKERYGMQQLPEGEVSADSAGIGMDAYNPILWLGEGIPDDGMCDNIVRFNLWQELGLELPEHLKQEKPSGAAQEG